VRVTHRPAVGLRTLSIDEGARAVRLSVARGHRVIVVGYVGEPVLRIDADGVAVNLDSPTGAESGLPSRAASGTRPEWRQVSRTGPAIWLDPRLGQLPAGARRRAWAIPLVVDGRPARIAGKLSRVARPSPWRWLLALVAAAALAVTGSRLWPGRRRRAYCAGAALIASCAALVAAAGLAVDAHTTGLKVAAVYELLFAAAGIGVAVWGPEEAGVAAAGLVGLLAAFCGLAFVPVFLHGNVLSALPAPATRAAVALAIGVGAGVALLAALFYVRAGRVQSRA